jgi:hypothetical protein
MPYQSLASNETREARDETGCCCAQCFYLLSLRRYITSCPTMFPALRAPFGRSFGPYRIADIPITTKVSPQLIILEIEILYSRKVDENSMTEIRAGKQKNVLKPNYQGRRPIKQNGPRGARPAGVGQKKDKFPFGIWHWDRAIHGVRSDHNRDREPVARKIIAKGGIITRTDCVLHEHQR